MAYGAIYLRSPAIPTSRCLRLSGARKQLHSRNGKLPPGACGKKQRMGRIKMGKHYARLFSIPAILGLFAQSASLHAAEAPLILVQYGGNQQQQEQQRRAQEEQQRQEQQRRTQEEHQRQEQQRQTIIREDGRTIYRVKNRYFIDHDEIERFKLHGHGQHTLRGRPGGGFFLSFSRPDGIRVEIE
jgi:hypothetical protein